MKTWTWRSSYCQKGSRASCKALCRWKRKITLATYLSLTSSIFYHGDSSMVRYLWYKVWICSIENLPGDRFKALANLSGKLHRKTRLAVSVLQISKTVSNINARLSLWLLERCYCLMKPSTSPCSSSSLIPSSLHSKIICLSCLAFVKDFFEFLKESSPCVSRKASWTRSIRK